MKKFKKDSLGNRMKSNYENVTKYKLPKRTYTIIRIDGKAFHTYTKGMTRPFDLEFINDMDETAKYLCENVQGAKLAFVQSDEISLVLTDFDKINTDTYYDGTVQKIASIAASMTTAKFNQLRFMKCFKEEPDIPELQTSLVQQTYLPKLAMFDSRVFTIPTKTEVINYIIWRQQDTTRNSIQSVAQSLYSHKELHGKGSLELQDMIFDKGINWDNYDSKLKRGRLIIKSDVGWLSVAPKIFTQDKELLIEIIPEND